MSFMMVYITSCTEETDLLIPTFQSDKDFSPDQIEHDLLYETSSRNKYIQFFIFFFNNQAIYLLKGFVTIELVIDQCH